MALVVINILDHFIPNEILCKIFFQYLDLKDISLLDVAFCNHSKREVFLKCIRYDGCIWKGDEGIVFNCQGINWLTSRKLKLRHLEYENITIEKEREAGDYSYLYDDDPIDDGKMAVEISSLSTYLYRLLINDEFISDDSVERIIDGCKDMQFIHLEKCKNITDKSIIRIAENCPAILYLDFNECSSISKNGIYAIANNCPLLRTLNLHGCNGCDTSGRRHNLLDTDVTIMKIIEGCPNIQNFNLGGLYGVTDLSLLKIAELRRPIESLNLGFTKITDIGISRVADECRGMKNLQLTSCKSITDIGILRIAQGCPNLKVLDM